MQHGKVLYLLFLTGPAVDDCPVVGDCTAVRSSSQDELGNMSCTMTKKQANVGSRDGDTFEVISVGSFVKEVGNLVIEGNMRSCLCLLAFVDIIKLLLGICVKVDSYCPYTKYELRSVCNFR